MADDKNDKKDEKKDDKKKRRREPVLDFHWDSLELADDDTYSTTIRIELSGYWEDGRPTRAVVSFRQRGEEPKAGELVRIQNGYGTFPLTGLLPRQHYHVAITIGKRLPVEKVIIVPELPKEATRDEKKTADFKAKTKLVQVEKEFEKARQEEIPKPKKPTLIEEKTASIKSLTELAKAEKEFKEAEEVLKRAEPPEQKRQIKILHIYRQPSRLEVVLQRAGQDGKPEEGGISVLDFEQGGIVFGDATGDFPVQIKNQGIVVVFLPYLEHSRRVAFFLPDDPDVKTFVDVPARERPQPPKEERKPKPATKPSLWKRMRDAYREEMAKARAPMFEFRIQRRQPLIFL